MNFQELIASYNENEKQYKEGNIDYNAYTKKLQELFVDDDNGVRWTIQGGTGKWLAYENNQWVEKTPPQINTPEPPQPETSPAPPAPEEKKQPAKETQQTSPQKSVPQPPSSNEQKNKAVKKAPSVKRASKSKSMTTIDLVAILSSGLYFITFILFTVSNGFILTEFIIALSALICGGCILAPVINPAFSKNKKVFIAVFILLAFFISGKILINFFQSFEALISLLGFISVAGLFYTLIFKGKDLIK